MTVGTPLDEQQARMRWLRDAPLHRPRVVAMSRGRFVATLLAAFALGVWTMFQVAAR